MMSIEQIHTIDELVKDSYETATDKGWHDPDHPRTVGELIALMHSELSEALEEHRDGRAANSIYYDPKGKPCGVPIELADCIIRIADFCGERDIDLGIALNVKAAYNRTRPHRHGGKVI